MLKQYQKGWLAKFAPLALDKLAKNIRFLKKIPNLPVPVPAAGLGAGAGLLLLAFGYWFANRR
jgi:hypothetical protein